MLRRFPFAVLALASLACLAPLHAATGDAPASPCSTLQFQIVGPFGGVLWRRVPPASTIALGFWGVASNGARFTIASTPSGTWQAYDHDSGAFEAGGSAFPPHVGVPGEIEAERACFVLRNPTGFEGLFVVEYRGTEIA